MKRPRPHCPLRTCVNHTNPPRGFYWRRGARKRKRDSQPVPRYQCKACGAWFCASQGKPTARQHRPELNQRILEMAVSGVSLRRMIRLLKTSKTTLRRKIAYLAREAVKAHTAHMETVSTSYASMDELETFLHAHYKTLNIPIVIRVKTGEILGFEICRVPSNMKLGGAGIGALPPGGSRWIKDDRPTKIPALLDSLAPRLKKSATFLTDGDPSYAKWISNCLPFDSSGVSLTQGIQPWPGRQESVR